MNPDDNSAPKLVHVRNPMRRLKLTFQPSTPSDEPVTDGPLLRAGGPLRRVRLAFQPGPAPFDLQQVRDTVRGAEDATMRFRQWCDEQWAEDELALLKLFGSAPRTQLRWSAIREQIQADRATANWYELVREQLGHLEAEITRRPDATILVSQMNSLECVIRDMARELLLHRIDHTLRPVFVQNGVLLPEGNLRPKGPNPAASPQSLVEKYTAAF